jgi:hypothetical protein
MPRLGRGASTTGGIPALMTGWNGAKIADGLQRDQGIPHSQARNDLDMSDNQDRERSEADAELEREIRKGRKLTLAEAIGRMAGPGAMKGESPVARQQQAEVEIEDWLSQHVSAAQGELQVVLLRGIKGSELFLHHYEHPLSVLAAICQRVLDSDYLLKELVRQADVEWGQVHGERPYFEQEGEPSHPDDPYTRESVRKTLAGLLEQLAPGEPS